MICSIIIRAFNEERHIGRLIDGIQRQLLPKGISTEIILVDSGSTDSTVIIARNMGAIIVSINKDEFSFGRALNLGCKAASGDIFLFASAHVYPIFTNWIEKIIIQFSNENIGLVYGRQVGNEFTHFSEKQVFNKWFPPKSNYNQLTPFCNNANCAIRKSLWKELPYDEYLTGLEDLDWAQKVMDKGVNIAYEADAIIVHVHEETYQKIKNRYRREAIALKYILPKVKFTKFDFIKLFISNTISDWYQAVRMRLFFKEYKSIFKYRFMQFYGTYIGHQQKGNVTKELKNRFYFPGSITKLNSNDIVMQNDLNHNRINYNN